jgi:hypothetical protein
VSPAKEASTSRAQHHDRSDSRPNEAHEPKDIKSERHNLTKLAAWHISDSKELASFMTAMRAFEERAREQGISEKELARTYKQVERLFTTRGDKPITAADRSILAQQIMMLAASPDNIDQGKHGTCNVSALESIMFNRVPSQAAEFIVNAAISGAKSHDGQFYAALGPDDFRKDSESAIHPPKDGQRSFASQIFQTAAIDLGFCDKGLRYGETESSPGKIEEWWIDSHGKRTKWEGITIADVAKIYERITGDRDNSIFLRNAFFVGENDRLRTFETEADLAQLLAKTKKFPVMVHVDGSCPPLDRYNLHPGADGNHVITISNYDPRSGIVKFSNWWGKLSRGQSMSVHDLFIDTHYHSQVIKLLEKDVEWNKQHHQRNYEKEYELLRLQYGAKLISEAEFRRRIAEVATDQSKGIK